MSCKCKCKGAVTARGDKGDSGIDGLFGGFSSNWLFDSGTANNPGVKDIRLNNADATAATAIYVNKTNERSVDLAAFLDAFVSGSNYGYIRLFDEIDSSIFHYFRITNLTIAGNVYTLTVTYIDGNGAFTDNNSLVLSFVPISTKPKTLTYSFATSTTPYITTGASPAAQTLITILFDGLTFLGASPVAYDIIYDIDGGGTVEVRITDETNAASIVAPINLVSAARAIQTLAPVGNEPNGAAVFTMQANTIAGTPTFKLYALNIKF